MWLSWEVASQAALVILIVVMVADLTVPANGDRRLLGLVTIAEETARVLVLYSLWQFSRSKAITKVAGAMEHGRWLWNLEQSMHLPSELALQQAFISHRVAMQFLNIYYATMHVPMMGAVLIWLFWRYRDQYVNVRNVLALTIAGCVTIQLIPLAPPRLMPGLGFVDAGLVYGQSVYGTGGSGISNQLAAMPSQHYAWSFLAAIAIVRISRSRWRWLAILHPLLTTLAVTVTANHWWLDGVVAAMVMGVAAAIQFGAVAVATGLRSANPWPTVRPLSPAITSDV